MTDEDWMDRALGLARAAGEVGEVPIAAVVVVDGVEVAAAGNRRELDRDPTAHAEILALRAAAAALGRWRLFDAEVFVTLEPCAMCAGALVSARVKRVVYGADDPKAGAVHTLFRIGEDVRLNHRFEVRSGVRAPEAAALLTSFFRARRRGAGENGE